VVEGDGDAGGQQEFVATAQDMLLDADTVVLEAVGAVHVGDLPLAVDAADLGVLP
jgi:hypothetical protein